MSFGRVVRPTFTPWSVPNMFAYWDAQNATTTGGATVDTMPNQSGVGTSARDLAKVGATGPTYTAADSNFRNFPSVSSTIADRRMEATFETAVTQPATWYLVLNQPSNAVLTYWRTNAGNFTASHGFVVNATGGTAIIEAHDASLALTSSGSFGTGNKVTCAVYNGANTSTALYSNNSATPIAVYPTDGSIDTDSATVVTIGTFGTAYSYSWACMIVYNGVHDANTRLKVMKWLGDKYGITVS